MLGHRVVLERKEHRERQVQLVQQGLKAQLDHREALVLKGVSDHKGAKVTREGRDQLEQRVLRVLRERQVLRDTKDTRAIRVHKVHKDRLGQKG
jgi:hypothetical protein